MSSKACLLRCGIDRPRACGHRCRDLFALDEISYEADVLGSNIARDVAIDQGKWLPGAVTTKASIDHPASAISKRDDVGDVDPALVQWITWA